MYKANWRAGRRAGELGSDVSASPRSEEVLMRFLIAILAAAGAVVVLPSTSATPMAGGHTAIFSAPVDDPIVKAITEQRQIEQSLSNATPLVNSFALRGGKAGVCDRMTSSTARWCLTTP